jgi:hypothetical protein
MPLTLHCPNPDCRASLKLAAPPPADKKLRCPRCGTEFAPPAEAPADAGALALAPEEDKTCPSCKAPMAAAAILCIHCGFNLKTGEKLKGPKRTPRKKERRDPNAPITKDELPELLSESNALIDLARKELRRLPYVLGLGDDPDMAGLRHTSRTGRCANPSCRMAVDSGLMPRRRSGTSVVKFNARGQTIVLDLCEDCTQMVLEDLRTRDKTALGYLDEARRDLKRAARAFPNDPEIGRALTEVRKVELLAGAEKPSRQMCFVATAAFGGPLAAEVDVLRRYRDEVLERSAAGRCFTRAYYRLSPPLAALIAARPWRRALARRLLGPLIAWCRRRLAAGARPFPAPPAEPSRD